MAARLYLVPAIGTGTIRDPRRPNYIGQLGTVGSPIGTMDYGLQPMFLVGADFTPAQDASLVAHADVTPFPVDLTTSVGGGNVQAARAALEAALIPAQNVNGSDTWLAVARKVAGMFQFMQRLNVTLGNSVLIDDTTKLNVQWNAVPANIQAAVLDAATSLGYSTAFIAANTQIRTIIDNFSTQWGDKAFSLGPVGL